MVEECSQNTNTGTAAFVNGGDITLKQVNDNDASVKIGHNGDIFISGSITDASGDVAAGRLVKGGAGTLFLEAANSYTGGTEIYNGAIVRLREALNIDLGAPSGVTAILSLSSDRIGSGSVLWVSMLVILQLCSWNFLIRTT